MDDPDVLEIWNIVFIQVPLLTAAPHPAQFTLPRPPWSRCSPALRAGARPGGSRGACWRPLPQWPDIVSESIQFQQQAGRPIWKCCMSVDPTRL